MKIRTSKRKANKLITVSIIAIIFSLLQATTVFASANTDVANTVKDAFNTYMKPQIMTIVNFVVIPIVCVVLVVVLAVKTSLAVTSYRKNGGSFEWHIIAILGGSLVFAISCPFWIWKIIGWDSAAKAAFYISTLIR